MYSQDINYLLLGEGTLLRGDGSGRPIESNELRQTVEQARQAMDTALESKDASQIAMASVQFQHLTQQTIVASQVRYTVDEDLRKMIDNVYTKRYRIGLVVSNKTAALRALKSTASSSGVDVVMTPDELGQHQLYFSDYAAIVTVDKMAKVMMPGVDYVHSYRSAAELDSYLNNPQRSWNYGYDEDDPTDPLHFILAVVAIALAGALIWIIFLGLWGLMA